MMNVRNIKLTIEYDGTNYSGWQSQINAIAIQDVLKKAIEEMVREEVKLFGASRTDAGVHALAQVATFKTSQSIPCSGFLKGLNSLLPTDIRIKNCEEVLENFHPTDHALQKTYAYLLEISEIPSALQRNRIWWVGGKLSVDAMQKAAEFLIGEHDFKSFQGPMSDTKTTVRKIESIVIEDSLTTRIQITGNGFLKYMIRNIVGTLVEIGRGERDVGDMKKILEAKDRRKAGMTAPPQGLYLCKIDYEN